MLVATGCSVLNVNVCNAFHSNAIPAISRYHNANRIHGSVMKISSIQQTTKAGEPISRELNFAFCLIMFALVSKNIIVPL